MKYDIVIVGGGHVGLYCAEQLSEQGYKVALLEKKKFIGERVVCTGIIGDEAFAKYRLPLDTVIGTLQEVRFHSPSGEYFDYKPGKTIARLVNRTQFNRYFEDRALKNGADLFASTNVEKIRVKLGGVHLKASGRSGEDVTFESEMLLLATGVNCKLFHEAGICPPESFLGGAQVHIPYQDDGQTSIFMGNRIAPGAFGWVVPIQGGQARVGLLSEINPGFYLKQLLDQVKPGWRDDVNESQIDLRPIVQGPLERSFNDRVLVVGEAAGQIKTTTGGGIYYGMLGADVAVEVLKTAFKRKRFSADVLSSYDKNWKKVMAEELRLGLFFRGVFAKWTDPQIEEAFNKVVHKEILSLAYENVEFDWHKNFIGSITRIPTLKRMFQHPF